MPAKQIALLIGNGTFGTESGFAALRCPPKDVEGMAAMLKDKVHGDFDVVTLVDAEQRQITMEIYDTLTKRAGFDDTVLLYYSGHGCPDEDGSLFLAASDSSKQQLPVTAVPIEFLVNRMRSAKSQKIVLILDCCFSGSIEKAFTKGEVAEQVRVALPKEFSGSGTYVLTASTDTQLAEEKQTDEYSLLTKHILSGIEEGTADRDDDGIVTMHELMVYVQETVKREGAQEPLGFALRAGGGELALARTGKPGQSIKMKEVEQAVWQARDQYHVPMKTAQCVWSMITESALEEGGPAARKRLEKLHRLIADSAAFVQELYDLSEAAERMKVIEKVAAEPSAQAAQVTPRPEARLLPQSEIKPAPAAPQPPAFVNPSSAFVDPRQNWYPQAPATEKKKRKWTPLRVGLVVIGCLVGLLVAIILLIAIVDVVTGNTGKTTNTSPTITTTMDSTPEQQTSAPDATNAKPKTKKAPAPAANDVPHLTNAAPHAGNDVPGLTEPPATALLSFNYTEGSYGSCTGRIFQSSQTQWAAALTGKCLLYGGTLDQVSRTSQSVLLTDLNRAGYALVPLAGGEVGISQNPNGPWGYYGYATPMNTKVPSKPTKASEKD